MKKINLVLFIIAVVALQLPLYTIMDTKAVVSFKMLFTALTNYSSSDMGTLAVYIIPLLGIIASVLALVFKKNFNLVTMTISIVAILYFGFIYFAVKAGEGSINIGFILSLVIYLAALVVSIIGIRYKN